MPESPSGRPNPAAVRPSFEATAADQARMAFVLHLRERGIADLNVLRALETVPREKFVPRRYADLAWRDIALPIACGQIMPDPYSVARTMEALAVSSDQRVLEIGAGSGYATAILSRLAGNVVSFERYRSLAVEANERLRAIGVENVRLKWEDGLAAHHEAGVYDRILIHLAVGTPPAWVLEALAENGRIVLGRPEWGGRAGGLYSIRRAGGAFLPEIFVAPVRYSAPEQGLAAAL